MNAFANSFNQHNKVRRPGESHRGAGRKKKFYGDKVHPPKNLWSRFQGTVPVWHAGLTNVF